ncbi:MAG: fibronectin type III domain-containing protein [Anaeromyxobacteraceae bacterium]
MRARLAPSLLVAAFAAALLAGCGTSKSDGGGGGGGGGSGFPQPGVPGTPIGDPTSEPVPPAGGAVGSPDGFLLVEVPPGAVPQGAQFTVQEVTNLAPGGTGPAWRLGPEGTTFPVPITLTFFAGATGRSIDEVTVAWQDDQGYWHRVVPSEVGRDPVQNTLTVRTNHLSSWTLTTTPTAKDFKGPFQVGTSVNGPFVAAGDATFTWAGEDSAASYYLLSGTLVLPSALGAVTCTPIVPDTAAFPLRTNVAELSKTLVPVTFDWGASGAWHVSCSDGSTRLVTVAFDTVGVGFTGCSRVVTRGEVAGIDAALGGVSWDCTARNQGQTSGSWDFASAACGTACVPTNPCKVGTVTCGSGIAACTETANVADGSTCGTDQVCSAGTCVGCTAGVTCTPSNPCVAGATSCATGASVCAESSVPATPIADGTTCGTDQVCSAGACVACTAGVACTPLTNPCHQGRTTCATGTSVCEDTGFALVDGSTCGTDLVCFAGACIACTQDAACTSTNACTATATYECSSGAAVCTDRTFQPPGFSCGGGLVCSAAGACDACSEGATCAPTNPCALAGTTSCASGSPVCVDAGLKPVGTSCGAGVVCNAAGQCLPCTEGATCTPLNLCMNGTTTCGSGTPVCVETTPVANGNFCGTNQVCSAGICTACTQGALCAATELCASTATIQCATGTPVCTPQAWLPAGAICGTGPNTFCDKLHACNTCNAGGSCTPANVCAATGTIQCGTGIEVCTDASFKQAGTDCGSGTAVCTSTGTCVTCTTGTTCTSTNPCAATATLDCAAGAICTDRTSKPDGTSCGIGLTCSAGACLPARTVTGTRVASYWADAGTTNTSPPGATTSQISALVRDGAGTWSTFSGTMDAAGAFTIPGVPNGPYWLRFQEVPSSASDGAAVFLDAARGTGLDLGFDQLGRSTVTRTSTTTQVTFSTTMSTGTNGKNWNAADQMQIASSNADVGDWLSRSGSNFRTNFASGTQSLAPLNLLKTGDLTTMFHLYSFTDASSTLTYRVARASVSLATANIPGGAAITVPAAPPVFALVAPTPNGTVPGGAWSTATFETYRTLMNVPTGTGTTHALSIGASVGPLTGFSPVPRNLFPTLFTMSAPLGTTNRTVGAALTYVHVLAQNGTIVAAWNEWRGVEFGGTVAYTAVGASTSVSERASMGRRDPLTALQPMAPTLSPVRNLTVTPTGGTTAVAAYTAVTGTGLQPTLKWDSPTLGTPTSYLVEVYRLGLSGTASTRTRVAAIYTGSTTVPFPPGILTAGARHYVKVTARAIPSDPWAVSPLRQIVAGAWAQTLSGTITP